MCGGGIGNERAEVPCAFKPVDLMLAYDVDFLILTAVNLGPVLLALSGGMNVFFAKGRKRQVNLTIMICALCWISMAQYFVPCDYDFGPARYLAISATLGLPFVLLALLGLSWWLGSTRAWIDRVAIFAALYGLLAIAAISFAEMGPFPRYHYQEVYLIIVIILSAILTLRFPMRDQKGD